MSQLTFNTLKNHIRYEGLNVNLKDKHFCWEVLLSVQDIVSYYIKLVTTSWTHSMVDKVEQGKAIKFGNSRLQ